MARGRQPKQASVLAASKQNNETQTVVTTRSRVKKLDPSLALVQTASQTNNNNNSTSKQHPTTTASQEIHITVEPSVNNDELTAGHILTSKKRQLKTEQIDKQSTSTKFSPLHNQISSEDNNGFGHNNKPMKGNRTRNKNKSHHHTPEEFEDNNLPQHSDQLSPSHKKDSNNDIYQNQHHKEFQHTPPQADNPTQRLSGKMRKSKRELLQQHRQSIRRSQNTLLQINMLDDQINALLLSSKGRGSPLHDTFKQGNSMSDGIVNDLHSDFQQSRQHDNIQNNPQDDSTQPLADVSTVGDNIRITSTNNNNQLGQTTSVFQPQQHSLLQQSNNHQFTHRQFGRKQQSTLMMFTAPPNLTTKRNINTSANNTNTNVGYNNTNNNNNSNLINNTNNPHHNINAPLSSQQHNSGINGFLSSQQTPSIHKRIVDSNNPSFQKDLLFQQSSTPQIRQLKQTAQKGTYNNLHMQNTKSGVGNNNQNEKSTSNMNDTHNTDNDNNNNNSDLDDTQIITAHDIAQRSGAGAAKLNKGRGQIHPKTGNFAQLRELQQQKQSFQQQQQQQQASLTTNQFNSINPTTLLRQYRIKNKQLVLETTNLLQQLKLLRQRHETLKLTYEGHLIYVQHVGGYNTTLQQQLDEKDNSIEELKNELQRYKEKYGEINQPSDVTSSDNMSDHNGVIQQSMNGTGGGDGSQDDDKDNTGDVDSNLDGSLHNIIPIDPTVHQQLQEQHNVLQYEYDALLINNQTAEQTIATLQNTIETLNNSLEQSKQQHHDELQHADIEKTALQEKCLNLETKLTELQSDFDILQQQYNDLEASIELDTNTSLKSKDNEILQLKQQQLIDHQHIADYEMKIANLKTKMVEMTSKYSFLIKDYGTIKLSYHQQQVELDQHVAQIKRLSLNSLQNNNNNNQNSNTNQHEQQQQAITNNPNASLAQQDSTTTTTSNSVQIHSSNTIDNQLDNTMDILKHIDTFGENLELEKQQYFDKLKELHDAYVTQQSKHSAEKHDWYNKQEQLQNDINHKNQQLQDVQEHLRVQQDMYTILQNNFTAQQTNHTQLLHNYNILQHEYTTALQINTDKGKEIQTLHEQIQTLQHKIQNKDNLLEQFVDRYGEKLKIIKQQYDAQLNRESTRYIELQCVVDELKENNNYLQEQINKHENTIEIAIQTIDDWTVYCNELDEELSTWKQRCEDISVEYAQHEIEFKKVLNRCKTIIQQYRTVLLFTQPFNTNNINNTTNNTNNNMNNINMNTDYYDSGDVLDPTLQQYVNQFNYQYQQQQQQNVHNNQKDDIKIKSVHFGKESDNIAHNVDGKAFTYTEHIKQPALYNDVFASQQFVQLQPINQQQQQPHMARQHANFTTTDNSKHTNTNNQPSRNSNNSKSSNNKQRQQMNINAIPSSNSNTTNTRNQPIPPPVLQPAQLPQLTQQQEHQSRQYLSTKRNSDPLQKSQRKKHQHVIDYETLNESRSSNPRLAYDVCDRLADINHFNNNNYANNNNNMATTTTTNPNTTTLATIGGGLQLDTFHTYQSSEPPPLEPRSDASSDRMSQKSSSNSSIAPSSSASIISNERVPSIKSTQSDGHTIPQQQSYYNNIWNYKNVDDKQINNLKFNKQRTTIHHNSHQTHNNNNIINILNNGYKSSNHYQQPIQNQNQMPLPSQSTTISNNNNNKQQQNIQANQYSNINNTNTNNNYKNEHKPLFSPNFHQRSNANHLGSFDNNNNNTNSNNIEDFTNEPLIDTSFGRPSRPPYNTNHQTYLQHQQQRHHNQSMGVISEDD